MLTPFLQNAKLAWPKSLCEASAHGTTPLSTGKFDSEFGMLEFGFAMLNSVFEMLDSGFGMFDSEFGMLDSNFGMPDSEFGMLTLRFGMLDSEIGTLDLGCSLCHLESSIRDFVISLVKTACRSRLVFPVVLFLSAAQICASNAR